MDVQRCSGFTTVLTVPQTPLANATRIPLTNHAHYLNSSRSMIFADRQYACGSIIDGRMNSAAFWQVLHHVAAPADYDAIPSARRATIVRLTEISDQDRERQERDKGG